MKMFAGKFAGICLLALALLAGTAAHGRVTAEVDRSDMALGETLRLTLKADGGELPDEIDLSTLQRDFEILQRSSATSTRIINGTQNISRTLELDLAPRRDGLLTIPAFNYGGHRTTPIAIKVAPQPDIAPDDALVRFDAAVDRKDVYVQAQVILTVTLQQAINLDNRAVSELDIPNTYIKPLEQTSFQRRTNGRLWQVTELRYALFPQKSGELLIPKMSFSGRELLSARSLLGARLGRRIAIDTDPIALNVKPVPANFPGDVWLPARSLELSSRWSSKPDGLSVGDSSTRTVELHAEGLQGSQLPPITSLDDNARLQGIRFYPDTETIDDKEVATGVAGYRLQSEALVATGVGTWQLPERVLPWWNTETDTLEYARLPAVDVAVTGNVSGSDPLADANPSTSPTATVDGPPITLWPWQLATTLGWLVALMLGWLLWRQRSAQQPVGASTISSGVGTRDLVPLRLACSENNAQAARDAVRNWGMGYLGIDSPPTLSALAEQTDGALADEIRALDNALYGDTEQSWSGKQLFGLVKQQPDRRPQQGGPELPLYPD